MTRVAPPLRPYVDSLDVYDVTGEPGVHIGMPSTSLTFVLPLGEPLDVAWSGRPDTRTNTWSSVSGLHPAPAEIRHGGRQRGVHLSLTVAGARALFGVPASALSGELLDLADLAEVAPELRHLPEQVHDADGGAATATVVEKALLAALIQVERPARRLEGRPEVGRALARLTRGVRVSEVADEVGYSRRHLGDLVRAESGLGPKEYQRVARFERSHGLVRDPRRRLSDVAAMVGYADHAHLTRDWVTLAGCTPTEWRRRELPSVQDETDSPD